MAFKPIEILINAKDNASEVFGSVREKLSAFGDVVSGLAGRLAAVFAIGNMARSAAEIETIQVGLKAVSGSAEKAAADMEFVRRMVSAAGVDVVDAGKAFLGLSAATKGTAVEGAATEQVFQAVTIAMAKAGKSSAETVNALQALGQMAGKGQVQMEELRGQLGEALPGAMNAAAKGLGITTKQLTDLVEAGQITAQDLFPALTKGLNELYGGVGDAQTLSQEFVNVKNAFTDMAASIGEAGGLSALKTGAELAQAGLVVLEHTIVTLGKSIGVLTASVATWNFDGLKQSFADMEAVAREKLLKAAAHNEVLQAALIKVGGEGVKTAIAQAQAGDATAKAGQQAAVAGDLWVKLSSGYGQVLTSVRAQIDALEKSVIARAAEGKAVIALADAFGTEAEKRDAQVKAATANFQALQQLAQARQAEVATMQAQLDALKQEAAAGQTLSDERAKQLVELQKQIDLRKQDAEKATAQAGAARLAAEQAKAEAEALRDNSGRVEELKAAYEAARAEMERVRAAKAAGKAASEELTQAELALGRAALVYRDALKDQLATIEAKSNKQRADLDVQAATVQLAIEQQRAIYELARARGNEQAAIVAQNEIRRLEIELLRLSAQAKRAEAEAAIATAEAKKAELIASGQFTGAKKLEIEAAIKAAEVKRLEGQIADTTADKLRDLASTVSRGGAAFDEASGHIRGHTTVVRELGDAYTDAAAQALAAQGQFLAAAAAQRSADTSASSIMNRKASENQFAWTRLSIIEWFKQAGLTEEIAKQLSAEFVDAQGNVPYLNNGGQIKYGGRNSTLTEALSKAAEKYLFGQQSGGGSGGASAPAPVPSAPSAPAAPSRSAPAAGGSSSGSGSGTSGGTGISSGASAAPVINVYPGVDFSNRAEAERLARFIAPVLKDLARKGAY